MTFMYVSNTTVVGTRISGGGFATEQSGSFASLGVANIYETIQDALADAFTAGELSGVIITVADNYNFNAGGAVITHTGPTTGFATIRCAALGDVQLPSAGAIEDNGGTNSNFEATGQINYYDMDLRCSNDFRITNQETKIKMYRCAIKFQGTGDQFTLTDDAGLLDLNDSTIEVTSENSNGPLFLMRGNSRVEWKGGGVVGSNTFGYVVGPGSASNGGYSIEAKGVDFGNIAISLIGGLESAGTDNVDALFVGCNRSVPAINTIIRTPGQSVRLYKCKNISDGIEQDLEINLFEGVIVSELDTGIHRNESTPFPDGRKISLIFKSNSNCSIYNPLRFSLPSDYFQMGTLIGKTLTAYLAVEDSVILTDTLIFLEMVASDSSNQNIYNYYSNRNSNYFGAGIELPDDSSNSDWRDGASPLTGFNEYSSVLDTSSNPASDSVPEIWYNVARPDTDVYFDVVLDAA